MNQRLSLSFLENAVAQLSRLWPIFFDKSVAAFRFYTKHVLKMAHGKIGLKEHLSWSKALLCRNYTLGLIYAE